MLDYDRTTGSRVYVCKHMLSDVFYAVWMPRGAVRELNFLRPNKQARNGHHQQKQLPRTVAAAAAAATAERTISWEGVGTFTQLYGCILCVCLYVCVFVCVFVLVVNIVYVVLFPTIYDLLHLIHTKMLNMLC